MSFENLDVVEYLGENILHNDINGGAFFFWTIVYGSF